MFAKKWSDMLSTLSSRFRRVCLGLPPTIHRRGPWRRVLRRTHEQQLMGYSHTGGRPNDARLNHCQRCGLHSKGGLQQNVGRPDSAVDAYVHGAAGHETIGERVMPLKKRGGAPK